MHEDLVAKNPRLPVAACPCGSGTAYAACCEPMHQGAPALTAEALMRSRYSAFVLGLEVKRFEVTGKDSAVVEFVARYKVGGKAQRLHEVSRFERIDGRWVYVDGEFTASLP